MKPYNIRDFKRPGTAAYVLAQSKLFDVVSTREDDSLVAGPLLHGLFREGVSPHLDMVAPAMADLVTAHALELSGFMNGTTQRIQAVAVLREQGISERGLVDLQQLIERTAQLVKDERAVAPAKAL